MGDTHLVPCMLHFISTHTVPGGMTDVDDFDLVDGDPNCFGTILLQT